MLLFLTHVLEEDAEIWVGLWVDGGLEHGKENVLQHFAKVGHKVPASEDVTKGGGPQQIHHSSHFLNLLSLSQAYRRVHEIKNVLILIYNLSTTG